MQANVDSEIYTKQRLLPSWQTPLRQNSESRQSVESLHTEMLKIEIVMNEE